MSHPERRELATESKFRRVKPCGTARNQGANSFATQGSLNGFCYAAEGKVSFPMAAYWSSFRDPTSVCDLVVLGRIGTPSPKLRLNLLASFAQDDSLID